MATEAAATTVLENIAGLLLSVVVIVELLQDGGRARIIDRFCLQQKRVRLQEEVKRY